MLIMLISSRGLSSSSTFTVSILVHTSMPFVTLPKTVCLLSNHGQGTVVIKNWDPFVPGPAFSVEGVKVREFFKKNAIQLKV